MFGSAAWGRARKWITGQTANLFDAGSSPVVPSTTKTFWVREVDTRIERVLLIDQSLLPECLIEGKLLQLHSVEGDGGYVYYEIVAEME